jgi:MFS family permease
MASATTAETPSLAEADAARRNFFQKFTILKGAPRELWLLFALKFVSVAAYSVTNRTLVLWLSSDFHFSDQSAGAIISGAWAPAMTLITLLVGSVTDAIGLRKTFILGVFICLFARCMMVVSTVEWLALSLGLFPLAVGEALGNPVLVAGARKFSTTGQRSFAFSLLYAIMNLGFYVAARVFDFLRQHLGEHGHVDVLGFHLSTYRALFLISLGLELLLLPLIYSVRKGAEMTDSGLRIVREKPKYAADGLWRSLWLTVRDGYRDTIRLFKGLIGQSGFYRLLGFLLLIGFLKVMTTQMDYVFPKFGIRELGEGAPVGQLTGINYILILILVPIIGILTQRFPAYVMVILGGTICAASVFIMALPPSWFQSMADGTLGNLVGHIYLGVKGSIHPYYVMIAIYIAIFSFGEAFYSPRVYEYAAAIAPKGQEASFGALSYVPLLLGKLLVGPGGYLLAAYCPAHGPRHSGTMWLIFAVAASISPVGLIVFRKFIRVREAGRSE